MYKYVKRCMDILLSGVAIIIFLLFMCAIAVWIKFDSTGPIFFKQKRIGKNKREFYILKFRTMYVEAPSDMPTHLLENPEKMITRAGVFLRKTSLDELPQLFNIFMGQMSIVGPRPALWNQYDLIEQRDRYGINDIVPGLTGWAQVNGRDELPIEEKVALDKEYMQRMSLLFDLKCIMRTIFSVAKGEGVVEGGPRNRSKE